MKVFNTAFVLFFCLCLKGHSQNIVNELLAAGVTDTQRFAESYIAPATEGFLYGVNNGWFNNAKPLGRFKFEISIVGNISFVKAENKYFNMLASDFENIRFSDNSPSKIIPTVFGASSNESVILTYDDVIFGGQEIEVELPGGIGTSESSFIPASFLQLAFSPLKGTEIKARLIPKLNYYDAKLNAYGFGIQQDLISWLPLKKVFPLAVSVVIAYTHLDGSYDFPDSEFVKGDNQQMITGLDTMVYQLVMGTKLKIINFYVSIGVLEGKTTTELSGDYTIVSHGISSNLISNPINISNKYSGMRSTFGACFKFGLLGINADYTIAKYNSANLGINIGL